MECLRALFYSAYFAISYRMGIRLRSGLLALVMKKVMRLRGGRGANSGEGKRGLLWFFRFFFSKWAIDSSDLIYVSGRFKIELKLAKSDLKLTRNRPKSTTIIISTKIGKTSLKSNEHFINWWWCTCRCKQTDWSCNYASFDVCTIAHYRTSYSWLAYPCWKFGCIFIWSRKSAFWNYLILFWQVDSVYLLYIFTTFSLEINTMYESAHYSIMYMHICTYIYIRTVFKCTTYKNAN